MRHLCIFLTHPFFSGFAINLQKADAEVISSFHFILPENIRKVVSFIQEYSVTLLVK